MLLVECMLNPSAERVMLIAALCLKVGLVAARCLRLFPAICMLDTLVDPQPCKASVLVS